MRQLVSMLTVAALASAAAIGCAKPLDGTPVMGPKYVDQAHFFAGDLPLYGLPVSAADTTVLAYRRALRRIDVCGLIADDTMVKIGETVSVGTLFAFNECDVELKVSGASGRQIVAVGVLMSANVGQSPAFSVGDTPVYENRSGICDFLVSLDLARLPGAVPLLGATQPFVEVGLIGNPDCDLARRITKAVAQRLTGALPPRDVAAAYPSRVAERDPCEVLPVIEHVVSWNIAVAEPYECAFSVERGGRTDTIRVSLEPQLVDVATSGRDRRQQDGSEFYLDPALCSAVAFVDAPMQRRVIGVGYVDMFDAVIRPAVVVDTDDCTVVGDIASRAQRLFGR